MQIEEWDLSAVAGLDGAEEVEFGNRAARRVSESDLAKTLENAPGRSRVKVVTIGHDSLLRDLSCLRAFPALTVVRVRGEQLVTLDGLESFHGTCVDIDTARSRKRDISAIARASFSRLILKCASKADLAAIASSAVEELLLSGAPAVPFKDWSSVPLTLLQLWGGSFSELADTACISSLTSLTVHGCRKLRAFQGKNDGVDSLVVQACPALDWRSVSLLKGLTYLDAVGRRTDMLRLSDLTGLDRLSKLDVVWLQVDVGRGDVSRMFPGLRSLRADRLGAQEVLSLSKKYPKVWVSNGRVSYAGGVAASVSPPE
jgi:hypothetical protein